MLWWLTGPLLAALLHVGVEVEPAYLFLRHVRTCATCILEHKVELVPAQLLMHPVNLHEPLSAFYAFWQCRASCDPVDSLETYGESRQNSVL